MDVQDQALTLSNPRTLAAVFFSMLAIIATLVVDMVLYALGIKQLVPISEAILLGVIVALFFGALFGERIVHSQKPYTKHVFFWAFLMVVVALPVYNIGIIYLMRENHITLFSHASLKQLVSLYLFVLMYSFILAGVWLAILAGLAALYLRGHIVYYILQSRYQRGENPRKALTKTATEQHDEEHHVK